MMLLVKLHEDYKETEKFINYLRSLDEERLMEIIMRCIHNGNRTNDKMLKNKYDQIITIIYEIQYERENNI